jgi:GDPmannose 4,6-dehydratase
MKRALITGVTGQDGAYLAQLLLGKGYEVYGTHRKNSGAGLGRLQALGVDRGVRLIALDLPDQQAVHAVIEQVRPDEVYNLAGQSSVANSFDQPLLTADVDATAALQLLEALRTHSPQARFFQASSGELFGGTDEVPQNETTPFHPCSPYAVAKLFAHWMTVNYRQAYGLFACSGILFSHESPQRSKAFVTRKISDGVARIKLGLADELRLGNLEVRRDWGFAGDYVRAMWLMLQQEEPDDYVVGTGETHSVREFAERAFRHVGLDWQRYVRQDHTLFRPAEVNQLVANPAKARAKLGWRPQVSFPDLVGMMVDEDISNFELRISK